MKVEFCIYGEPQGKGRPRFSSVCGHVKTRTPEKTVVYENLVQTEYRLQAGERFPDDAMLDLRVFAYYGIPKSASKKKRQAMLDHLIRPTKKPDADNVCKVICDSLNGVAYRDDTQVVDCMVRKLYSDRLRRNHHQREHHGERQLHHPGRHRQSELNEVVRFPANFPAIA